MKFINKIRTIFTPDNSKSLKIKPLAFILYALLAYLVLELFTRLDRIYLLGASVAVYFVYYFERFEKSAKNRYSRMFFYFLILVGIISTIYFLYQSGLIEFFMGDGCDGVMTSDGCDWDSQWE